MTVPDWKAAQLYWSENQTRPVTKQGEDEGVIGAIRRLMQAAIDDEKDYRDALLLNEDVTRTTERYDLEFAQLITQYSGSTYSAIWNNPSALKYYSYLLEFSAHFRLASVVKVGYVRANLSHIHGGVSRDIVS